MVREMFALVCLFFSFDARRDTPLTKSSRFPQSISFDRKPHQLKHTTQPLHHLLRTRRVIDFLSSQVC